MFLALAPIGATCFGHRLERAQFVRIRALGTFQFLQARLGFPSSYVSGGASAVSRPLRSDHRPTRRTDRLLELSSSPNGRPLPDIAESTSFLPLSPLCAAGRSDSGPGGRERTDLPTLDPPGCQVHHRVCSTATARPALLPTRLHRPSDKGWEEPRRDTYGESPSPCCVHRDSSGT